MTLDLAPLDCPACGSAMRGDPFDALFFCDHCGSGAILESHALKPVESTALLPAGGRRAERWLPGWILETQVSIERRTRADGSRDPDRNLARSFVVPAFPLPLSQLMLLIKGLDRVQAETREVPREPIRGGTLSLTDATTLVRHLVVGEEVEKPDVLASVEVSVAVKSYRLVALPFEGRDQQLRCAITGVSLRL